MKVFVTGITGFVGRNLAETLLAQGHEVVGLVRKDIAERKPEMFRYLKTKNVKIAYGDVTDPDSITEALKTVVGKKDIAIVHLAAVIKSKDINLLQEVNVKGTENLYEAVLRSETPVSHIIHFSTAAVHGPRHPGERITEETPLLPETPYERSKYRGEMVARKFMEDNDLPITILRPVHVYGPHSVDPLIVRLIKGVGRGFTVIPSRLPLDLVYVKNLTEATLLVMDKRKKSIGQTYLINDGKNYTTDEVVTAVKKILKHEATTISIPRVLLSVYSKFTKSFRYGLNDVSFSSDKIVKQLGYKPKFTLEDGLGEYITWLVTAGYLGSGYLVSKPEAGGLLMLNRTMGEFTQLAFQEGEGFGMGYEFYAKSRILRKYLAEEPPKRILIAGLPEKYGYSSDFTFYAHSLGAKLTVIDENRDRLLAHKELLKLFPPEPKFDVEHRLVKRWETIPKHRQYDMAFSHEVFQRLNGTCRQKFAQFLGKSAKRVAIFAPNAENKLHAAVDLRTVHLRELIDTFSGHFKIESSGYLDMPPFPPGIRYFAATKKGEPLSVIDKLLCRGLNVWYRLVESAFARVIPCKKFCHVVYVIGVKDEPIRPEKNG